MVVKINADGTTASEFTIGIGGPTIRQGNAIPTNDIGANGDIYLRIGSTPIQFRKADGVWVPLREGMPFMRTSSSQGSTAIIPELSNYHGVTAGTNTATNLTLPSGFEGRQLIVKDEIGNGNINLAPAGPDVIEGGSTLSIDDPFGAVTLVFHSKWRVIRLLGASIG